ncbi:MAG: Tex-like N-terminal domain-containing protein [Planctomycetota bacterium]
MDPIKIDISVIARDLKLAPHQVESAIELLDDGNTIPFVTRFRKDQTGGLNEEQLLAIKTKTTQLRALSDRKSTILRAIESQSELTDQLKSQILKTTSSRRLEDIYAPFKTRKQSRASLARQQGLGPLADEILNSTDEVDFATRATDFVRVDKGLNTVDDVIKGVGDLVAEKFSENDSLRLALRKLIREQGQLNSSLIVATEKNEPPSSDSETVEPTPSKESDTLSTDDKTGSLNVADEPSSSASEDPPAPASSESTPPANTNEAVTSVADTNAASNAPQTDAGDSSVTTQGESSEPSSDVNNESVTHSISAASSTESGAVTPPADATNPNSGAGPQTAEKTAADKPDSTDKAKPKPRKKKKKKKEQDPFKDYHDYSQALTKLPHHQVLAINRGERSGKLRVKIKIDPEKVNELAYTHLVPENHPSESFLKKCANETLSRSLIPSLEREIRRELTEAAERHAVDVFANNLKNLLLQPPTRNRVIMAIDPGYKRGCSVAIIDSCGNLIESGQVFVVGNQSRRDESKTRIHDWVMRHKVDVIAIGNGTGCRQVEQMVSDTIAEQLSDHQVRYIIINEAGTSIYSTSEIGREELPDVSPATRSAVSIGRRLLDPLSELVKIAPANIGVGMYQHDIKAKHLSESLDAVVQACVNRVGVDVNTASSALLKYVSGLNALTARRVVEFRIENGRFNSREELKNVNGVGQTTYIQAAGFLRVHGGSNPMDATSIHPECYGIANDILERVSAKVEDVFPRWLMQPSREEQAAARLAQEKLARAQLEKEKAEKEQADKENAENEKAENEKVEQAQTVSSDAAASVDVSNPEPSPKADSDKTVDAMPNAGSTPDGSLPAESAASATSIAEPATETSDPPTTQESAGEPAPTTEPSPETTSQSTPTGAPTETPAETPTETPIATPTETTTGSTPPSDEASSNEASSNEASSNEEPIKKGNRKEFEANRKEIVKRMTELDIDQLAKSHQSGRLLVKDVILSLKRPAWDPRDKVHKPLFRRGILKADDLQPEMQLDGQVVNVVDFGVFVDIGLGESSLVHVSQLSNHYISDPFKHYSVGDVIKVWVTEIDSSARRVKLTAIRPGTKKPPRRQKRGERKPSGSADHRKPQSHQGDQKRSNRSDNKGSARRDGRKPGKYDSRSSSSRNSKFQRRERRPSKPKEVKPITEKMLRGDEPMKSFSDLAQFVRQKPKTESAQQDAKQPPKSESNNDSKPDASTKDKSSDAKKED